MMKQIYPNLMGWNARVILRHMPQPYLMAGQELTGMGNVFRGNLLYGNKKVFQGQLATIQALRNGIKVEATPELASALGEEFQPGKIYTFNSMQKPFARLLQSKGMYGADQHFEAALDDLKQGVSNSMFSRGLNTTSNAVDAVSNASMFLFRKADLTNRTTAYFTGQGWGEDFISALNKGLKETELTGDEKAAVQALTGMEAGYRTLFKEFAREWLSGRGVKTQDQIAQQIKDSASKYLINKGMFDYSRASMSQFGRSAGPFFSMFTTWPINVSSDMVSLVRSPEGVKAGTSKLVEKYFYPLVYGNLLDKILLGESLDNKDSWQRLAIGSKGFAGWAPTHAVLDLTGRNFFASPAYSAVHDIASMVIDKDVKNKRKSAENLAREVVPGMGTVRFLTEDLPTYTTGTNPHNVTEFFKQLFGE
jgi:hypothetical protein